jgi:hypothetical protein
MPDSNPDPKLMPTLDLDPLKNKKNKFRIHLTFNADQYRTILVKSGFLTSYIDTTSDLGPTV